MSILFALCCRMLFFLSLFVPSPFLKLARPQRKIPCIRAFCSHGRGSLLSAAPWLQIADCRLLLAAGCWRLSADGRLQHQSPVAARPKGRIPVKNGGFFKSLDVDQYGYSIRRSQTADRGCLLNPGLNRTPCQGQFLRSSPLFLDRLTIQEPS